MKKVLDLMITVGSSLIKSLVKQELLGHTFSVFYESRVDSNLIRLNK